MFQTLIDQQRTSNRLIQSLIVICSINFSSFLYAANNVDDHFDWDSQSADDVNEGQLVFLTTPPDKPVLHLNNTLILSKNSIDNGWVKIEQCYTHLDKVADIEILYQYKYIKDLKLVKSRNIGDVQITNHSAILKHVGDQAELCTSAEVRNFYQNPDKTYSLVNGPYHRRFLDGYYPYHLSLKVNFAGINLRLVSSQPATQTGFKPIINDHHLSINTLFEGRLMTELVFELTPPALPENNHQ